MTWTVAERAKRRHRIVGPDQRGEFERDRDRILYSSAFRRLAGITQIVRAGEADVFHTRQQHTLKVAQVGRRLAQICLVRQPDEAAKWGIDADVVEAACLAHDLGHPPFGHVGEHALNDLLDRYSEAANGGETDGFEGNAQSFRVLTRLSVRFTSCDGLDLTRATLGAVLKYPWFRQTDIPHKAKKWGAYRSEHHDFNFTQNPEFSELKTAEAELMDWADDIAYSVHDLEDFHRCGAIPWKKVLDGTRTELLIRRAVEGWYDAPPDAAGRLREAMRSLERFIGAFTAVIDEPYEGTREQRQELRSLTSQLIGRYMTALTLVPAEKDQKITKIVNIDPDKEDEVRILKQITRDYIISTPALVAQQFGQEKIIRSLFEILLSESRKEPARFLPTRLRYLWSADVPVSRFAADCIASLTEAETVGLHARLHGLSSGSVLDPIVR